MYYTLEEFQEKQNEKKRETVHVAPLKESQNVYVAPSSPLKEEEPTSPIIRLPPALVDDDDE